jgi:hypothetical protein
MNSLWEFFSERDYARKVFLKGKSSENVPVSDVMTEKVFVVQPVTIHGNGCQSLGTFVLQEAGNGFVDLQTLRSLVRFRALRSLVHEKSS